MYVGFADMPKTGAEIEAHYDKFDSDYDNIIAGINYNDHVHVRDMLRAYDFKKDMRIIDFGCGTGALGVVLKPEGYTNIDGCDASQKLLDNCK